MRLPAGLELIEDDEGFGKLAERGDRVTYNVRIFLNRGDEVPLNETQAQAGLPQHTLRLEGGRALIDHRTVLGQQALLGMKPGGHRKVRVSPHLAYGKRGIPGLMPPNAVLTVEIWMRDVTRGT
jgi:hypothetical protein